MRLELVMRVAFTGHRPPKIGGYNPDTSLRQAVQGQIRAQLVRLLAKYPDLTVLVGGALGVDTDAGFIAHELNIPFTLCAPCRNQDKKWFATSKADYAKLIGFAQSVVYVHDGDYTPSCMSERNKYMVDNCDGLIAIWDGSSGGTGNCVRYAKSVAKPVIFIDPRTLS